MIHNGYPVPVSGWYEDPHGHRLFLRSGDVAPICPRFGLVPVVWRLLAPVADRRPTRPER